MFSLKTFIERHGETGAWNLLEIVAKREHIDIWSHPQPLEKVWVQVMTPRAA